MLGLPDEAGGQASYELAFANGGVAYVLGNIIQQSLARENTNMIAFAVERYESSLNKLYLVKNTLVDYQPIDGKFLRASKGAQVLAISNLLLGEGDLETETQGDYGDNFHVDLQDFVLVMRENFHRRPGSRLIGKAVTVDLVDGVGPQPVAEYKHPRSSLPVKGCVLSPGAMQ